LAWIEQEAEAIRTEYQEFRLNETKRLCGIKDEDEDDTE
jgi:hypothetical protein